MDNASYASLTRQSGLNAAMRTIANNVANATTTGFRREGVIFSEYIRATGDDRESLSMAAGRVRFTDLSQASLKQTGGTFDFGIEGEGFFLLETPEGERLTRAGIFTPNADGELVTPDGFRVLDAGGAPVFIPPDASSISVAKDGTLSADGTAVSQLGLWRPIDSTDLRYASGTTFEAPAGTEPIENPIILQGFTESSNVNAISEISRMLEVQRAYELGQSLIEREDDRIRKVTQTLGK